MHNLLNLKDKLKKIYNYNLIYFKSIDSTNTYLKNNFQKLPDKTIVVADEQTQGKGRFNRVWVSKKNKGLFLSILLKSNVNIENLSLKIATIVCDSITKIIKNKYNKTNDIYYKKLISKIKIKWPNDIYINNKKVAGILIENIIYNKNIITIIGIGVNLNYKKYELNFLNRKVTSLNLEKLYTKKSELIQLIIYNFQNFFKYKKKSKNNNIYKLYKHIYITNNLDTNKKRLVELITISNDGSIIINKNKKIEKIYNIELFS